MRSLVPLAALALLACDPDTGLQVPTDGADPGTPDVPADALLGPEGGMLALDEFRVEVPAGAVTKPTDFAITPGEAPDGHDPDARVYQVSFEGTLDLPVRASLPGPLVDGTHFYRPSLSGHVRRGAVSTPEPGRIAVMSDLSGAFFVGPPGTEAVRFDPADADALPLDVLMVVDDSACSTDQQVNLRDAMAPLLERLVARYDDVHFGLTTSDVDRDDAGAFVGAGSPYLDLGSPDLLEALEARVMVGARGSASERGLAALELALTEPRRSGFNRGFRRDDAGLLAVVTSDEPDQSDPAVRERFPAWFQRLGPSRESSRLVGFVGPEEGCSYFGGFVDPGDGYLEMITATDGVFRSACEPETYVAGYQEALRALPWLGCVEAPYAPPRDAGDLEVLDAEGGRLQAGVVLGDDRCLRLHGRHHDDAVEGRLWLRWTPGDAP